MALFGLIDFLTSSSTTRLYRGLVPRLTSNNFKDILAKFLQVNNKIISITSGVVSIVDLLCPYKTPRETYRLFKHLTLPTIYRANQSITFFSGSTDLRLSGWVHRVLNTREQIILLPKSLGTSDRSYSSYPL